MATIININMIKRVFSFLIFLALMEVVYSAIIADYQIVTEENGNSFVLALVQGDGTVNVPLPLDTNDLVVKNALYVKADNGINILVNSEQLATMAYKTSLLTSKDEGVWVFEKEVPEFDEISISLLLPPDVEILKTEPIATIENIEESTDIEWNLSGAESIIVEYKFIEADPTTTSQSTSTIIQKNGKDVETEDNIFMIFLILIIFLLLVFIVYQKKGDKDRLVLSKGKRNVMKTLQGNELKILNLLLENDGGMKRNDLEKRSGIAKSSLASSLHNLEQKNIVRVDKSNSVHYVELTEWFKSL